MVYKYNYKKNKHIYIQINMFIELLGWIFHKDKML
jgi:hypothetical protein